MLIACGRLWGWVAPLFAAETFAADACGPEMAIARAAHAAPIGSSRQRVADRMLWDPYCRGMMQCQPAACQVTWHQVSPLAVKIQ